MLFRFIGKYTGGRNSINACGATFYGRDPADVTDEDGIRRLLGNPEFEVVGAQEFAEPPIVDIVDDDDEDWPDSPAIGAPAAKPRGRPKKAK